MLARLFRKQNKIFFFDLLPACTPDIIPNKNNLHSLCIFSWARKSEMVVTNVRQVDRETLMDDAGQKLKRARERLNLRYRDVEEASLRIAERHKNEEFIIALSRLSDIENKGTVPTIYRLYTLCAIYRLNLNDVLRWYSVDPGGLS